MWDLLLNPFFSLPLLYEIPLMLVYGYAAIVIVLHWKELRIAVSVVSLFVVSFMMNFTIFLNSFITMRLPSNTKVNGTLAFWFNNHDASHSEYWIWLNVSHWFYHSSVYSQCLYHTFLSLFRLKLIIRPNKDDKYWRLFFLVAVVVIILVPLIFMRPILFGKSFYIFDFNHDFYYIDSTHTKKDIYSKMAPIVTVIMFINFAINVTAHAFNWRRSRKNSQTHFNLKERKIGQNIRKTIFTCLLEDISCVTFNWMIYYINVCSTQDQHEILSKWIYNITPFVSDILTFSPLISLLYYSRTVQKKCVQFIPIFRWCSWNKVGNTATSIGTSFRISRNFA